eukprot:TRINITY_DN736_c1_g1_i1.p1 TRINITY_DN736_c1_g1~~TRINITY_DN736_c1_g1_i1.p1  ORF type:complete len:222 (+),score=14.52 TRINITY_DN736_c1_g1_i1:133-798(+)
MGFPSPLTTLQVLWLNLMTDGFPAVALAVEKAEPGSMTEGPKPPTEPLIEKVMLTGIALHNTILTVILVFVFLCIWRWESGVWEAQLTLPYNNSLIDEALKESTASACTTACILVIVTAELLRAHTSRSLRRSVFTVGVFTNFYMQISVAASLMITWVVTTVPGIRTLFSCRLLSREQYAFVIGISFIPCIIDEITKFIYRLTGFGLRPKAIDDIKEYKIK